MVNSVKEWLNIPDAKKPMLTFSGPPEVGKTHLLKEVFRLYSIYESNFPYRKFNYPEAMYIVWSEFTNKAIDNTAMFDKLQHAGLVIIEDFLSDLPKNIARLNAFTDIVVTFAYRVLNARVGKATIIDTNKSISYIEQLDSRISSRLFREEGKFLEIPEHTTRYLDRK